MAQPHSPAIRRYTRRLSVFMGAYVALILAMGWLFRHAPPPTPWNAALALLPALPILGVIWTVMRLLVEETDEFWRMLFVRQTLIATGFCLTVMTIWEFLQNYDVVPQGQHGFGTAFFWFMGLGLGAIWNGIDLRRQRSEP
jgi:hypothetical protein